MHFHLPVLQFNSGILLRSTTSLLCKFQNALGNFSREEFWDASLRLKESQYIKTLYKLTVVYVSGLIVNDNLYSLLATGESGDPYA